MSTEFTIRLAEMFLKSHNATAKFNSHLKKQWKGDKKATLAYFVTNDPQEWLLGCFAWPVSEWAYWYNLQREWILLYEQYTIGW